MMINKSVCISLACSLLVILLIDSQHVLAAETKIGMGNCEGENGPIGCWQFEEGSGTTTIDGGADSSHPLQINGSPQWIDGHNPPIPSKGLYLNGQTQFAFIPTVNESAFDIQTNMTLSAWIRPGKNGDERIVVKGAAGLSACNGYELSLASSLDGISPGKAFFRINQYTKGNEFRVSSTSPYPANNSDWIHVAGTYDKTNNIMRIYYNGGIEDTKPASVSIATNDCSLTIGGEPPDHPANRAFVGGIDDVRVYNRALLPYEVAQLAGTPTAVTLTSFQGNTSGNIIYLTWSTAVEDDLVGFNIYRSSAEGTQRRLNESIIPAVYPGQLIGADYSLTDVAGLGQRFTYSLELVKTDGNWPGPSVDVMTGFWLHIPILMR